MQNEIMNIKIVSKKKAILKVVCGETLIQNVNETHLYQNHSAQIPPILLNKNVLLDEYIFG